MTSERLLQRILRLTLVALVVAGFGSVYSQPKSGDWKVPTDFGEFVITVSDGGSSITKVKYTFASWKCGGVTLSGGMTSISSWSITNNQFTIRTNLNSFSTDQTMTINGTFSPAGDQVSGTWSADMKGTICSGSWGPISPIVSIDEGGGIPKRFALEQNYPNPLNPSTTITYELPKTSYVSLIVYDTFGRDVRALVNDRREAGVHEVKFDGSGLSGGVYFYRLHAGDFVQTKRLVILK